MHIVNAEDHGFELGILHHKKLIFNFGVDYGVESEFAFQIGQFRLFGFQQDVCDRIQHILTYQNHQKDKIGHQMIQDLYAAIRLEEFYFVSHSYVSENGEAFTIVR